MCGRYVSSSSPESIAQHFGAVLEGAPLEPSYNVAPTNQVYAIVGTPADRPRVEVFRWGLVPSWATDTRIASRMINARAETLAEKPSFRRLFATNRCIVPMDGFYEWAARPGGRAGKQPMYIHRADGQPLAAAGLWTAWRDKSLGPDAPWLHTVTVVTTAANTTMSAVHDRMPALLDRGDWDTWLDPSRRDTTDLATLLRPAPDDQLVMHPVSSAVGNVRNKGAELVLPVDPQTTSG